MLMIYREIATAMHMQRALSLFTAWLNRAGMSANKAKSKVVVFSCVPQSHQPWLINQSNSSYWFQHLSLDGFSLSLTDQFVYLGVTLDTNLNWEPHKTKLLKKVSATSSFISQLYYKPKQAPPPLAAVQLVRSLLLPVITYGIEFWCNDIPSSSNHNNFLDKLQTLIIRPLRMATNLPTHTHRLGVLVDFGLTSVYDLAQQAIYRNYQRYANAIIHAHPKIVTAKRTQAFTLSVSRFIQDAFHSNQIKPSAVIRDRKWITLGGKARFVVEPAYEALLVRAKSIPKLANLAVVKSLNILPAQGPFATPLNMNPPVVSPTLLADVGRLATFIHWKDQHAAVHPDHKRKTTAPLTEIKLRPGIAPSIKLMQDHLAISTLMRLRSGRAFTQVTRIRFHRIGEQSTNPLCKFDSCKAAGTEETVEHLLLKCPRYNQVRIELLTEWSKHCYGRPLHCVNDLKLHQVLGEAPGIYNQLYDNKYRAWYASLSKFILAVRQLRPVTPEQPSPL